jgi:hypothetical protein
VAVLSSALVRRVGCDLRVRFGDPGRRLVEILEIPVLTFDFIVPVGHGIGCKAESDVAQGLKQHPLM